MKVMWVADKLGYDDALHDVGRWYLSVAPGLKNIAVIPVVLRASPRLVERLAAMGLTIINLNRGRFNPLTLWALIRLIRRNGVNVVHVHGYGSSAFGRIAARFCRVPVIVHQHDSLVEGPWYARLCDRLLSQTTADAIAVSESVRAFCQEERSLSASSMHVYHPAVHIAERPLDQASRDAAKTALGIARDQYVVGVLSRLVPEKGLRCLVEAVPRILASAPQTRFLIVGEGPERKELENATRRLGVSDKILWLGYQDDPARALSAMDVFVSACVVDGATTAIFEAMAAGLAIVATAVSGTTDVLTHDKNAWLIPSRDPRALADAVRHLLNDPDRRAQLGSQAWQDSRRFDIRDYADRLSGLYHKAVSAKAVAAKSSAVSPWARFRTLFRYMAVGASGATVHLGTLWFLVELIGLPVLVSTTTGFVAAVISNFILNRLWTFKSPERNVRLQFVRFVIVSLWGMAINVSLMWVLVHVCRLPYLIGQVLTIGVVSVWNFLANTYWTFQPIRFTAPAFAREQYPYDVSVIIPALDEEHRLPGTLKMLGPYFRARGMRAEVIVVDDGSTDRTLEVVTQLPDDGANLRLIHHAANRGKGAAVRAGFRAAQGAYLLMMDADSATPIEALDALWKHRQMDRVVIGSRHVGRLKKREGVHWLRYAISWFGNRMIQLLLLSGIEDTQCGFKLFSFPVAKALAARQRIQGFGFDMELLAIARALGIEIREVDVPWKAVAGSRVRPIKDAARVLTELVAVKANLMTGVYHIGHGVELKPGLAGAP